MKIFTQKRKGDGDREWAALLNLCDVDIEILYAFQNHTIKLKCFPIERKEM